MPARVQFRITETDGGQISEAPVARDDGLVPSQLAPSNSWLTTRRLGHALSHDPP